MMWRNATTGMLDLPDPTNFGYEIVNSKLKPKPMSQPEAALELMNDLVCTCEGTCHYGCVCLNHIQPCTAACSCQAELDCDEDACTNYYTFEVQSEEVDNIEFD